MKSIFTKVACAVLTLTFLTQFAVSVSASDIKDKVGYVYGYVDPADKDVLNAAYVNSRDLKSAEVSDSAIEALMTDGFKSKYADTNAAKSDLVALIGGSFMAHFAYNEVAFDSVIAESKTKMSPVLTKLFGSGTEEQWIDLLLLSRKNAQKTADWTSKKIWATGTTDTEGTQDLTELFASLDNLQIKEAEKIVGNYSQVGTGMEEIGWTVGNLVSAMRAVSTTVDPRNSAEYALVKAACRSDVVAEFDGTKYNSEIGFDKNVVVYSVNDGIANKTVQVRVMNYNVSNVVGFSSSSDLVTPEHDDEKKQINLNFKQNTNGIADVTIKRDPLRDNSASDSDWIIKLRFVVKYDLSKPSTPVWNSKVISWNPVQNAVKYLVKLYRDDVLISKEYTDKLSLDETANISGAGAYKVTVTAIGTLEDYGEISAPSDYSAALTVVNVPGQVAKPVWESETTDVIAWTKPSGTVTGYNIYVYNDGVLMSAEPYKAGANDTSYDLATVIGGKKGKFTVAVQAFNTAGNGAISEKSDERVSVDYKVTGYVKLQGSAGLKENNAGISVTIPGITEAPVMTAADGSFAITGLTPGSYTVKIERKGYLAMKKVFTIGDTDAVLGTAAAPLMLFYGDLDGINGISSGDIAKIVLLFANRDEYVPEFDIDDDGRIYTSELVTILANAGKTDSVYN